MPVAINGTTGISGVDGSASTPAVQGSDTNTGVFYPAADTVAIATNGSEVLRANSSGNVGIGTTSPTQKLDVAGGINATGTVAMGSSFLRNRIINGDMRIDQRNAGASGTAASAYTVDRWAYFGSQASKGTWQQNAGAVTPPTGYGFYLGFTSSSAYSVLTTDTFGFFQPIEGFNFADFGFGAAGALSVTLSFWVRSSLTGTHGGSLKNYAGTRSYPFTYTISSANTWEYKTVTIPGDTSGTWVGASNAGAAYLNFGLGVGSTLSGTAGAWAAADYRSATGAVSVVGTNAATWYITGVQLEVGSVATPFERRLYGQELALCQRYYTNSWSGSGKWTSTTACAIYGRFPVTMRSAPNATVATSPGNIEEPGVGNRAVSAVASSALTANGGVVTFTTASATSGAVGGLGNGADTVAAFSAEL